MTKLEIVKETIKVLRNDMELANHFSNEHNSDMVLHMLTTKNAKIDLLSDLKIIDFDKWKLLMDITGRMFLG